MLNTTDSLDDTRRRDSTTTRAQSTAAVSPRAVERPTNNLPIQLSSFIGREREIAEVLVVSERTVETHVANILNKLGFTSRA